MFVFNFCLQVNSRRGPSLNMEFGKNASRSVSPFKEVAYILTHRKIPTRGFPDFLVTWLSQQGERRMVLDWREAKEGRSEALVHRKDEWSETIPRD